MKSVLSVAFLLVCALTQAATPPSQDVVDLYARVADQAKEEDLIGKKSRHFCQFSAVHSDYKVYGKNTDEAIQRLQLLCIKDQCKQLGSKVDQAAAELRQMPEQDLRDFLEFNGMSPTQIDSAVQRILYEPAQVLTKPQNCQSASPLWRTMAFDSCFAVPVECR